MSVEFRHAVPIVIRHGPHLSSAHGKDTETVFTKCPRMQGDTASTINEQLFMGSLGDFRVLLDKNLTAFIKLPLRRQTTVPRVVKSRLRSRHYRKNASALRKLSHDNTSVHSVRQNISEWNPGRSTACPFGTLMTSTLFTS